MNEYISRLINGVKIKHGSYEAYFLGQSERFNELVEQAEHVAKNDLTVIISGETGTGKELLARLIHFLSERRDRNIQVVSCTSLNGNVLESTLFGFVKGAYTGAFRDTAGAIQCADKGTLFIDEIGDATSQMQERLLRVIEERTFCKVGSVEEIPVDTRFICTTNKNIESLMDQGKFREDLYYRLRRIALSVPPLRHRLDDIDLLVKHIISYKAPKQGLPSTGISEAAINKLKDYDWPGNVRELEDVLFQAIFEVSRRPGELIKNDDIDFIRECRVNSDNLNKKPSLDDKMADLESGFIKEALDKWDGNKTKTAKELGISFRALRYRKDKYRI